MKKKCKKLIDVRYYIFVDQFPKVKKEFVNYLGVCSFLEGEQNLYTKSLLKQMPGFFVSFTISELSEPQFLLTYGVSHPSVAHNCPLEVTLKSLC